MFDFEILTPYIEIIFPVSLIIAIMLLLVPVMDKRYVAKARYFVWLVIAIRLLLPFDINVSKEPVHLINAPISDYTIIREDVVDYIRQENVGGTISHMEFFKNKDVTDKTDDSQASPEEEIEKPILANFPIISLHTIIEWVWSLGTVGLFMYYILQYFIAKVHIRKYSSKDNYGQIMLNKLCKKMNIKRKLKIYRCRCVNTAMIMGVMFPAIFIPDTETSDEMLEIMLYHELTHYKRKDVLYKFVLMLACCMHWFNPLVWLMDKQAQKDVELCCDDDVIKGRSEEFKQKYCESILKMVKFGTMRKTAFSTGFSMDKKTLANRFRNIFDSKIKYSGKTVLVTVLALCIISTTFISCTPKHNDELETPQQSTIPPENSDSNITENISDFVIDAVNQKETSDFFNDDTLKLFNNNGYSIEVQNINVISNDKVKFDIFVKRDTDNKTLEVKNLTALLSYWEKNLVHSHMNMYVYGAVANICEGELIFAGLNEIKIYDAVSFKEKNTIIDVSSISDNNLILTDILKSSDEYWAVYYADDENQGIAHFNSTGKYIDKGLLNLANPEMDYIGKEYNNENYNRPFFMNNFGKLVTRENTNQLFLSEYTAYDYDEKMYYIIENIIETTHNYEKIYIERWRPLSKGVSEHLRITGIKDGQVRVNKFDFSIVEQMFSPEMLTGGVKNNVKVALAHDNRDLVIECTPINGSFIIDRQTNSIRFVKDIYLQ